MGGGRCQVVRPGGFRATGGRCLVGGIYLLDLMFVFGLGGGFWGMLEEKSGEKLGEVVSFQSSVFSFWWSRV